APRRPRRDRALVPATRGRAVALEGGPDAPRRCLVTRRDVTHAHRDLALERRRGVEDYLTLVRPRISAFVIFAAFTGALLGAGPHAELVRVALAALFVGLVGASSSVFNQVAERDTDRLMPRTADRPLAAERMSVRDAVLFGAALGLAGVAG